MECMPERHDLHLTYDVSDKFYCGPFESSISPFPMEIKTTIYPKRIIFYIISASKGGAWICPWCETVLWIYLRYTSYRCI